MDDIIRIIKSLENSGVLIYGVSATVTHEIRKQAGGGFLCMLLGTLGASMLENMLTEKVVLTAGNSVVRAGRGYNNMDHMDKVFSSALSFKQYQDC